MVGGVLPYVRRLTFTRASQGSGNDNHRREHAPGSGTIVRDGAAFAALTGQAVHVINVRTQRDRPGLRPQHLKALQACAYQCQGQLSQAHVGSEEWDNE